MATVRKRKWKTGDQIKTAWVADYTDQHGQRHVKTFDTKKAADAFLIGARHEVQHGTHTAESGSLTVGEAADRWLDAGRRESLERSTLRQYENHVRHHIKPLIGAEKLSSLSGPRCQKFADDLLTRSYADDDGETLSRSMAKKVLSSLKGIIKQALREGNIAKNPADAVTIKLPKRGTKKIRAGRDFPSKAEINTMIREADARWRPLLLTAVFTGMRSSELRGLTWDDVDFEARVIHVRQRADAWGKMDVPKSESGERAIPMTPMVTNALREWKLACPRLRDGGADAGRLWLVFPNGEGRVENHANIANRGFYALQLRAGIFDRTDKPVQLADGMGCNLRARYGVHTLRHFFASWIIEQGFQPKKVQGLIGHSSIQMTFDTYGHLFPNLEDDHIKMAAGELALIG